LLIGTGTASGFESLMSYFAPNRGSSAVLPCDAALIYEILTDYDHFSEWLPHIRQSKTLATEGDLAIAEFEFTAPRKERFVVECIHTRNQMVLWRAIEGRVPITQVQWEMAAPDAAHCQVSLLVSGLFSFNPLRAGPGKFLDPGNSLKALWNQAFSFMPEIVIAAGSSDEILDLSETEDGVICRIHGKKYVLKRESGD
jgi:ribosome-associated toxin RatA of RatAB toxin-antitoxin module